MEHVEAHVARMGAFYVVLALAHNVVEGKYSTPVMNMGRYNNQIDAIDACLRLTVSKVVAKADEVHGPRWRR